MQRGFSLVELSIVLVILGLLTGGILAGQSLIRAAELRGVSSDSSRYMAAINTFRDKYFAYPGDMTNATKFWTNVAGNASDNFTTSCSTTSSSGQATCNGNGDGAIGDGTYEMFRFWQHLANAGLIEGSYTGINGGANQWQHVLGQNCPRGKVQSTGFAFSTLGLFGDPGTYNLDFGSLIWFGSINTTINHRPQDSALSPEEAWNVDTKLDDGKPGQGKVIARGNTSLGTATNCSLATGNTDYAADYRLTLADKVCGLMIRNQ